MGSLSRSGRWKSGLLPVVVLPGSGVDPQAGRLYASSVATDEVLIFDLTGKKIGSLRPSPPDKLEGASGLALVKGKLYVLNTYGNRLSSISLPAK